MKVGDLIQARHRSTNEDGVWIIVDVISFDGDERQGNGQRFPIIGRAHNGRETDATIDCQWAVKNMTVISHGK